MGGHGAKDGVSHHHVIGVQEFVEFRINQGALRLYQRHNEHIAEASSMVASDYLAAGEELLLTRIPVSEGATRLAGNCKDPC